MKKNLFGGLAFFLLSMAGIQSCDNVEYAKEVMCTDIFSSVMVYVEDLDGNGFVLDSVRSVWGDKELIATSLDTSLYARFPKDEAFPYPVVNDNWQKEFRGKTETVIFTGYKNGNEVVSGEVKVTADECHISSPESSKVFTATYSGQVMCTEEFISLIIYVKDKSGNPFLLDSICSTWGDSILIAGRVDESYMEFYQTGEGRYPIVDDTSFSYFIDKIETIEFKGFKNDKQVVSGQMKVTADRCHIRSVEEAPTFIVSE